MDEPVLLEAHRIVNGPRQAAYGSPSENYQRLADMVNAYLRTKLLEPLTAADLAMVMLLGKVAREAHRPKRDNRTDIAGYAQVIDCIHSQEVPHTPEE